MTKLQTALGFTPEQVATLPPPLVKIRELELENGRLNREIEELRRLLADPTGRGRNSMESNRRESLVSFHDSRLCDRDYKRRKINGGVEEVYMVSTLFFRRYDNLMFFILLCKQGTNDAPPHTTEIISRPPPLTIPGPQPMSHHYSGLSQGAHSGASSSSMFSLHAPAFQMPNTPSGSSSTSSPPFSASPFPLQYSDTHLRARTMF